MVITEPMMQKAFSFIKDKGEADRLVDDLKLRRDSVELQMANLVEKFKRTFRPPWKSHLSLQRLSRGRVYIRWRASGVNGHGQSFFELFGTEHGMNILMRQSVEVRQAFCEFESQRIELNMSHSVLTQTWIRMRQHIVQLNQVEQVKNSMRPVALRNQA